MKQEQVLDHVIGLVDHFKQRKDHGELDCSEAWYLSEVPIGIRSKRCGYDP